MELKKPVRVQIFMLAGVYLALLAGIGFCKPSLESTEGVNCVKSQSTCSDKYISESYFEKHDSLIDFSFHSYIANELKVGSSGPLQDNPEIKLSVEKRHLIGEGAHRRLLSTIKIDIYHDRVAEKLPRFWKFVIVERLPDGIFADPFELQHFIDRGVFTDAAVFGDTNLELPSVASNRSIVEVHINIGHDKLVGNKNGLKIEIELPLHARYAPLRESGFSKVEFGRPDLFVLCNNDELPPHERSCLHTRELDAESQSVFWEVPCGIKEHSRVVSGVTYISAVVSALFIVVTTLYNPRINRS